MHERMIVAGLQHWSQTVDLQPVTVAYLRNTYFHNLYLEDIFQKYLAHHWL